MSRRRNGQIMNDQIMNYSEPPFCRIFKDLDVLLIQVRWTAVLLGACPPGPIAP